MDMMLPVTLVTAGLLALVNLWLAIRVGQVRTSEKISVGDGGNERVLRRMRAHANLVEYAPFVLILIALAELANGTSIWLWVVGLSFVVARVLHAFGMDGWAPGRMIGTIVTMLTLLGLGLYAIVLPHLPRGAETVPVETVMPDG